MSQLIILIRHAQSEGNKNREIHQTVPDHRVRLTSQGHQQALEAGRKLRGLLRPDDTLHFFTSPYRRTRETTEGILSTLTSDEPSPSPFPRHTIKVYEEPRLREQDFGNFQPCSTEMERMWQQRADYGHFFYRIPNGESAADAYDRVSGFNDSLWRRFGENDFASVCILVTHGLMTRVFLMKWYHFSVEYFEDLRNVNHCEFVVMKRSLESGKYLLQNRLRTWTELKRERAARAEIDHATSEESESTIPQRRRWGSCPKACDDPFHNHGPIKPLSRQNTLDLFRDDEDEEHLSSESTKQTVSEGQASHMDRAVIQQRSRNGNANGVTSIDNNGNFRPGSKNGRETGLNDEAYPDNSGESAFSTAGQHKTSRASPHRPRLLKKLSSFTEHLPGPSQDDLPTPRPFATQNAAPKKPAADLAFAAQEQQTIGPDEGAEGDVESESEYDAEQELKNNSPQRQAPLSAVPREPQNRNAPPGHYPSSTNHAMYHYSSNNNSHNKNADIHGSYSSSSSNHHHSPSPSQSQYPFPITTASTSTKATTIKSTKTSQRSIAQTSTSIVTTTATEQVFADALGDHVSDVEAAVTADMDMVDDDDDDDDDEKEEEKEKMRKDLDDEFDHLNLEEQQQMSKQMTEAEDAKAKADNRLESGSEFRAHAGLAVERVGGREGKEGVEGTAKGDVY